MCDATLRPPDGRLELLLEELALDDRSTRPERVTRALAAALERLGDEPVTEARIEALTIADRQVLMRALAAALGRGRHWITRRCAGCGAAFDLELDEAALPVKEVLADFAEVTLDDGRCLRLRLPTGADQRAVVSIDDGEAALRALIARLAVEPEPGETASLSAVEIERIEAALEAVAPQATTALLASCPECGGPNEVRIDPYEAAFRPGDLLDQVHRIASAYHWPEAEILALPAARRRRYLGLIDRSRGMVG